MCQPKPKFYFAEDGNGEKGSGMRAGELAALTKTMVMLLFLHWHYMFDEFFGLN